MSSTWASGTVSHSRPSRVGRGLVAEIADAAGRQQHATQARARPPTSRRRPPAVRPVARAKGRMDRMAGLAPPCYGSDADATRARPSCRQRRIDPHEQAPVLAPRPPRLSRRPRQRAGPAAGGRPLAAAELGAADAGAQLGRCSVPPPTSWSPSVPRRSRSPGTATSCTTSRSPPGSPRSTRGSSATSCSPSSWPSWSA